MIRRKSQQHSGSSVAVTPEGVTAAGGPNLSQKSADEVLRKHDTSSRYRTDLGWFGWVVGIISIIFTLYHLYSALERPLNT